MNHTVDQDEPEVFENEQRSEKDQENDAADNIKSKPNFEVDIVRNGTTLSFTCSFLPGEPLEGEYGMDNFRFWKSNRPTIDIENFLSFLADDIFGIQELTIYKGEFGGEKVYACSGDVLDGYLYDLLMNFLEEKGISNEFSGKLIALSTDYERAQYINLLESLKTFVSGN